MVDDILQGKDSKAKNDFIFLLHNLVHGMGQAIIHGDKEQKDYFYGYGDRRPYYHHHYYGTTTMMIGVSGERRTIIRITSITEITTGINSMVTMVTTTIMMIGVSGERRTIIRITSITEI